LNPELPQKFEEIINKSLEKDRELRCQSAGELRADLKRLQRSLDSSRTSVVADTPAPSSDSGSAPVSVVQESRRFGPAILAACALVALAIGVIAGRMFFSEPPAPPPLYRQLTFRRGSIRSARFAPDGQTILYSAAWQGSPMDVFTARPEAPEARSMGLNRTQLMSVSSTSEMAVLLNAAAIGTWVTMGTLARAPLVGGAPREVLEHVQWADWAPDGTSLAVVRDYNGQNRLEYPIGKVLYETGGWISHPRFSPQGDKIAFLDHPVQGDDSGSLAVVDLQGKK
jgi:hypothetical protein